jgi:hypothetical protein
MEEVQRLRERSARCKRLILEMTDPVILEALRLQAKAADEAVVALGMTDVPSQGAAIKAAGQIGFAG